MKILPKKQPNNQLFHLTVQKVVMTTNIRITENYISFMLNFSIKTLIGVLYLYLLYI